MKQQGRIVLSGALILASMSVWCGQSPASARAKTRARKITEDHRSGAVSVSPDVTSTSIPDLKAEYPEGRFVGTGTASWYGPGFRGQRTASGEMFNENALTAAHRTLPFGTRVEVVDQRSGRSVVVRINDRGPHARGRLIDLSRASAQALGMGSAASVRLVERGE